MQHTVLARKWRPKKFADLVGQTQSVTILKNIINRKRYHHAYLLTGTRGVGKTTIARIIAKALNCLHLADSEPCGVCSNCTQIDLGRFVDVIEIDAASNTGVDNVRELIEDAKYTPTSGDYKVYIIDEVHMLSKSAFNAMLKTLEEPPAHAIFILATTDLQKVPVTILSRCLQLKLRNLLPLEIQNHLAQVLTAEQVDFEPSALELLAKSANGSMRDGLSLLDQAIAFAKDKITTHDVQQMLGVSDEEVIYNILDALCAADGGKLVTIADSVYKQGDSLTGVLNSLRDQLFNISLIQLALTPNNPRLQKYATSLSVNDTQLYFEIANLGLEQLPKHTDQYSIFVMTLLRMLAFHIGTSEQKEIKISNSNFGVVHNTPPTATLPVQQLAENKPQPSTTTVTPQNTLQASIKPPAIPAPEAHLDSGLRRNDDRVVIPDLIRDPEGETPIHQNADTTMDDKGNIETPSTTPIQIKFSGDWFGLITELKSKLGYLYPVLENAKLTTYNDTHFGIMIDERYSGIFVETAIHKVNLIFNEHFGRPIALNISFAHTVDNTLKSKIIEEKKEQTATAVASIELDANLNKIVDLFSATIVPGSIESL